MAANAYTRQYPNSFQPDGTTVLDGFKNDDAEIRRILSLLDAMTSGGNTEENSGGGGGSAVNRNSIINAAISHNGYLDCFIAQGEYSNQIGIRAENPIILSFASGFAGKVPRDYVTVINETNQRAWQNLPNASTVYLYAEYNVSTRLVSFGYTTTEDCYSYQAPQNPKAGDCWYDMSSQNMKCFDGQVWQNVRRIFFAQATVDSKGNATIANPYPAVSRVRIAELTALIQSTPKILADIVSNKVSASALQTHTLSTDTVNAAGNITTKKVVSARDIVATENVSANDVTVKSSLQTPVIVADKATLSAVNAKGVTITDKALEAKAGAVVGGTLTAGQVIADSANIKGTTTMDKATVSTLNATSSAVVKSLSVTEDLTVEGRVTCKNITTNRIPYEDEVANNANCNICIWSDHR